MKRMILLVCLALVLVSCRGEVSGGEFTVTAYNVQNLMDAVLDGTEYEEYRPANGWSDEAYRARLRRLSSVLISSSLRKSDVFILEEVENERVLYDLVRLHLARWGYGCYAAVKGEGQAIAVGLVSRTAPSAVRSHAVIGGRPLVEAEFDTSCGKVIIIGLHAKSQIGEDTEIGRIECMRTVQAIAKEHRGDLVLVMGDFNEDPDCSVGSDEQTALVLTDLQGTALYGSRGSMVLSGEHDRVSGDVWYNPFLDNDVPLSSSGTCYFNGVWHRYDQIVGNKALFDRSGWEFSGFSIYSDALVLQTDGKPYAWDRKLLAGYSDHLPVTMTLKASE